MTELDAELGPLAVDLINEYGKLVVWSSISAGAYNSNTRSQALTPSNSNVKAIVEEMKGDKFNGNLVKAGDKKLTVAANGISKPQPGDKFTVDGVVYQVAENGVKTTYSGELACLYEIQAEV